jgi:hypothetical protein
MDGQRGRRNGNLGLILKVLYGFGLAPAIASAQVSRPAPSIQELARTVVTITVELANGQALGSGVIVDPSGIIATAAHVIQGAQSANVRTNSGEVLKVEGVIEVDADLDLALIRVAGFQMPTARLGNSDSLILGQRLFAVGSPMGLEATVTDGLLSSFRNDGRRKLLQISIPVSHGSSGGPVFNEQGQAVGLVLSGIRPDAAENLNFALPINYVRGKLGLVGSRPLQPLADAGSRIAVHDPGVSDNGPQSASPNRVNTDLNLNWRSLDGVELSAEFKTDNGVRTIYFATYSLTSDAQGRQTISRHYDSRIRVKVAPLRSEDAAKEAGQTELVLGSTAGLRESYQRTGLVADVQNFQSDLHVDGRTFSFINNGVSSTGTIPEGTLSPALFGAAIAALPDSLPPRVFLWLFEPASGRAEPTRIEFQERDTVKVPIAQPGRGCRSSDYPRNTKMVVVWATSTSGASQTRFAVLASQPHIRATPGETTCIRLPQTRAAAPPR